MHDPLNDVYFSYNQDLAGGSQFTIVHIQPHVKRQISSKYFCRRWLDLLTVGE